MGDHDDAFAEVWIASARQRVLVGLNDEKRVRVIGGLVEAGLLADDVAVLLGRARAVRARDPAALVSSWLLDPAERWARELEAARASARAPGDRPAARYEPADAADAERWIAERCWCRLSGDRRSGVEVAIEARLSIEGLRELLLRHVDALGTDEKAIDAHLLADPKACSAAVGRWLREAARRHAAEGRERHAVRGRSGGKPRVAPDAAPGPALMEEPLVGGACAAPGRQTGVERASGAVAHVTGQDPDAAAEVTGQDPDAAAERAAIQHEAVP